MKSKIPLSLEEVEHVARLANLPLTDIEVANFRDQLSQTIDYVADLNEIDTREIVPTPQVTAKTNEFRKDEVRPGLTREQALKNAKSYNGYFISKVSWT